MSTRGASPNVTNARAVTGSKALISTAALSKITLPSSSAV